MVSGQLQLRGADPFDLEAPTTISGTNTDGQLSGVTLTTPAVTTTRPVPEFNTTVTIGAAFSMVEPGVGTINEAGNITVQLKLAVDLHIVVPILPGASDCRAAPINLTLTSSAPLDGERVTLRAPNFSVPPVVASPACNGLLVDPVNEALAGAGHALTFTLAGAITAPPEGEPTTTTLAASPAGVARFGQDVILTATVIPDPVVTGAPPITGVVSFLDRGTNLGTAEVGEDGAATLTTTDLAAGPRQLQAIYGGAPPDWDPSTSTVVPYTVTADPVIVTTAAGEVRIGGPGKDFDLTVVNTGFGAAIDDARVEVEIVRPQGSGPIGPNAGTPRIVLSSVLDGVATPIPLTFVGGFPERLRGTIGAPGTWLIPPGEDHTEALRLEVAAGTVPGPLRLAFSLVTDEEGSPTVLGSGNGNVTIVNAGRAPTTIISGDPGFPPFIPEVPPVTPVVRQGNVIELRPVSVLPSLGEVNPTGALSLAIDGVPIPIQSTDVTKDRPHEWVSSAPAGSGSTYLGKLPVTVPTGTRQITVRYSGDALYAPSQMTWPITVEPRIGEIYECRSQGVAPARFTANVEVQATLPEVWPVGQDAPLDRVEVRLRSSRTSAHESAIANLFDPSRTDEVLQLDLGPGGEVDAGSVSVIDNAAMSPGDGLGIDSIIDLGPGTGEITVDHAPGTRVGYRLDTITLTAVTGGFIGGIVCTADPDPYPLGEVTAAGTTLTVEPGGRVGLDADVALTAWALPAAPGVVEFRDGSTTIGVVRVDAAGMARMTTDDLPVGIRSLTARFFGGLVPTAPSVPVELRVIGECPGFLDEGSGAVARLVYLELLGRCPDAAGYAFWTGRLDGGTTPEAFARSIASTPEAVGRVVDDAYRTMLGRPADGAGRTFWTGRLLGHGRYDQLLADLGASPEFWSLAGSSNTGFVTRVYDRLLHRAPDAVGLDYWTGRLAGGTSPRVLVLTLANLDEPLGVLVKDSYGEILDRVPDAGERSDGIVFLRATGDRSGLYAQLIGTGEFDDRAQTFPNPD